MKRITYLLALVAFAAAIAPGVSAQTVLFADDMDVWQDPWVQPYESPYGTVSYEDGELRIMDYTDDSVTGTILQDDFDNFILSVETRLVAGNDDNWQYVYTRLQESGGYVFAISADGFYQILKSDSGTATALAEATTSEYINTGRDAANIIEIESNGDEMNFFVNGYLLESVRDTRFSTGQIALGTASLSGRFSTAGFDNLVITEVA